MAWEKRVFDLLQVRLVGLEARVMLTALEVSEWQHSCNVMDLPEEFLENGDFDCDPIIGNPDCGPIDWGIERGEKRLGGGYFRYCPYCGAKLPQTDEEAMAIYQLDAAGPAPIKVGG